MTDAHYIVGDTRDVTRSLPDNSVDLIFTSPPFLALRSYLPADHPAKAREIGSESTPAEFLGVLLELVREWERVLTPTGSLVVELGDTFSGSGGGGGDYLDGGMREGQQRFAGADASMRESNAAHWRQKNANRAAWPLAKSLCGIPTLFTWSLAYGRNLLAPDDTIDPWRIRNVVVWHRPNPPVGALGDKYRPSTSYITVATKSAKRWFDLDAVRHEADPANTRPSALVRQGIGGRTDQVCNPVGPDGQRIIANPAGAPPLDAWFDTHDGDDVWTITTDPYKGSHYATFPRALAARVIDSMCPRHVCRTCGEPRRREVDVQGLRGVDMLAVSGANDRGVWLQGARPPMPEITRTTTGWSDCGHDDYRPGIVYDPFAGSGTTLAKAIDMGRDAIGADLDERNADLARERCGMFLTVDVLEATS